MLDPLFPVRLESLTHKNAQTVMSQGEYLIALLAEGRSVYKHASERGVLEQGRLFLAGERTAFTLTLQRASLLKTVRFNRSFYDRLALQFYDSGFLDSFFPAP